MSRRRSVGKSSMRQEIHSSYVGQAWGKDAKIMRRIDRARRKRAVQREIRSA